VGSSRAAGQQPERRRFSRSSRIRLGSEIRGLLREGSRARSDYLDVFTAPSPLAAPRFGAIVPLFGRNVVSRNQLRRRLREIGRIEVLPRLVGRGCSVDVLVRSRPRAYEAGFGELRTDLLRLTERLCSDESFSG
jgi:ribonuclease P protein component